MFDIGFSELVLVAVIALLVLGPERLPTAARTAGRWVGSARRLLNQLNQEVEKQVQLDELREKLRQEKDHLSAEQVQKTVDDALQEARKFKHLVDQDISSPTGRPLSPQPAQSAPSEPAQEPAPPKPIAHESVAHEPVAHEPVAHEPTVHEPVSEPPAQNPDQAHQDISRQP